MLVGSRCLFRRCPASSRSAKASPANIFFPMALPGSSISATAPPLATTSPLVAAPRPATSSRWRSATAPLPAVSLPLRRPRPATNLIRQRSTPVWLAIWRIWAGFANSQHRDAAFATPNNICAHSFLLPHWAAAQTDANLSAHLHRLPTPPPYLRRMRLSPGWGASIRWVIRLLPGRMRRSCKSPRARILVLGTSGAHWPARWPRFELTERIDKS